MIIDLIANTRTRQELRIKAELDQEKYPLKTKATNQELSAVPLIQNQFPGDWNCEIRPAKQR